MEEKVKKTSNPTKYSNHQKQIEKSEQRIAFLKQKTSSALLIEKVNKNTM